MASLPGCTMRGCKTPPTFYCAGCKGWGCKDHGRFVPLKEVRLTPDSRRRVPATGVMFVCNSCQGSWLQNGRPTVLNF